MHNDYINVDTITKVEYLHSTKSTLTYHEEIPPKKIFGLTIRSGIKAGWMGKKYNRGWWCPGSRKTKPNNFRYTSEDLENSEYYMKTDGEWFYTPEVIISTSGKKYRKFFTNNLEADKFIRSLNTTIRFIKI